MDCNIIKQFRKSIYNFQNSYFMPKDKLVYTFSIKTGLVSSTFAFLIIELNESLKLNEKQVLKDIELTIKKINSTLKILNR